MACFLFLKPVKTHASSILQRNRKWNRNNGIKKRVTTLSSTVWAGSSAKQYCGVIPGFPDYRLPVLFIDIRSFQGDHDVFSYKAGDHVIEDLGRMIQMFFPGNQAGRKGGDEFIVVFETTVPKHGKKAHKFAIMSRNTDVRSPRRCALFSHHKVAGYGKGFCGLRCNASRLWNISLREGKTSS